MILFACKQCDKTYDMTEIAQDEGGPTPGAYRCPADRSHQLFMSLAPELPITFDSIPQIPQRPVILDVEVAPFIERAADNPYYSTKDGTVIFCYWCRNGSSAGLPEHKPDCLHLKAKALLGRKQ